ncbi:hypothetical protein [Sinorhizobium fredii]|uniref:hypothetical protein n=1 Tax=Rhizobium fredii TaxID=380 RepID=UPI003393321A
MEITTVAPRYVIGKILAALVIEQYFQWGVGVYDGQSWLQPPSIFILIAATFLVFEAIDSEDVDPSVKRSRKIFICDLLLVLIYLTRFFLLYKLLKVSSSTDFNILMSMSTIMMMFFILEGIYQLILIGLMPSQTGGKQSFSKMCSLALSVENLAGKITDHRMKRVFYLVIAVVNSVFYYIISISNELPTFLILGPVWSILAVHALLAVLYAVTWRLHHYSKYATQDKSPDTARDSSESTVAREIAG